MKNDTQLLQIFEEEANDLLEKIQGAFKKWSFEHDPESLSEILRDLHTLKGSARMVGMIEINEFIQSIEKYFRNIYENTTTPPQINYDEVQSALDYLSVYIIDEHLGLKRENKSDKLAEYVKIGPEQLEKFSVLASEMSISRRQIEQNVKRLIITAQDSLRQLTALREQTKQLLLKTDANIPYQISFLGSKKYEEFDVLEMDAYSFLHESSRSIADKSSIIEVQIEDTLNLLRKTDLNLVEQKKSVKSLEESIMRSRLISLKQLVPRLERLARQVATELSKNVKLECLKVEGDIDRKILEQLMAPLEHMIRNAIDHGIGTVADRKAANKPLFGTISLSLYKQGNDLMIEVSDDGKGINIETIQKTAVQKNLWPQDKPMSLQEAVRIVLLPGFSTKDVATPISGQGVGLDVVNSEVNKLGGVLKITSKQYIGTTISIRLPLALSSNKALVFSLENTYYGLPLSYLAAVKKYTSNEFDNLIGEKGIIKNQLDDYDVVYLRNVLGYKKKLVTEKDEISVIFFKLQTRKIAFVVDELIGSWEMVIKPLSSQLMDIKEFSGLSLLGDEKIVLMLDPYALIQGDLYFNKRVSSTSSALLKSPTILIVDDSATVRRVTSRFLKQHDFEPIQARDGHEALLYMTDHRPDVVLLDLEMPEMDGFEVLEKMRESSMMQHIPVIIITSRSGEKHRLRAEKFGIAGYFTKPYLEEDLLKLLNGILHET